MDTRFEKGWHNFINLCIATKDIKTLETLFHLFLTPNEQESLAMRYMIIKELLAGKKTQREIAQDLNVSIAKITRGSNELKRVDPKSLRQLQEKIIKIDDSK